MGKYFGRSVPRLAHQAFPHHPWEFWRFKSTPPDFHRKKIDELLSQIEYNDGTIDDATSERPIAVQARLFAQSLARSIGFDENDPSNWYRVSWWEFNSKEKRILKAFGGLNALLQLAYPEHSWDRPVELVLKKSTHTMLKRFLHEFFPNNRKSTLYLSLRYL